MKVLFMGGGQAAQEVLDWTIAQSHIEIVGVIGDEEVQKCACAHNCRIMELDEAYQELHESSEWTDLAISFLYWRILKAPIIDVPKYGCINFHPAPLPDYKGRAGCSFAILDQLTEWGCTAHYVDAGIDTGKIIDVERFSFDWHTETGASLKRKTAEMQKNQYKKIMSNVLACGILHAEKQMQNRGRYISKKEMLDAMEIHVGKDNIDAKIQAFWFPPHEGAYLTIQGKRFFPVNRVVLEQIKEKWA